MSAAELPPAKRAKLGGDAADTSVSGSLASTAAEAAVPVPTPALKVGGGMARRTDLVTACVGDRIEVWCGPLATATVVFQRMHCA